MEEIPEIHFAPSGRARIAYQFYGTGDAVVVSVPPMAQNIEMSWERPEIRRMLERFGSFARFLVFDKRGTGSSDRTSEMPGIDERVEDLRAVMDHAGVDAAHIMGTSEGGPMAIMFAVSYPQRVQTLILHATGAKVVRPEILDAVAENPERLYRMADTWGTPESLIVAGFAPTLAEDKEFCRWHQRYERRAATQDSLRDLLDLMAGMDVTEALASVTQPTLVQHRIGDRIMPIDFGRHLAAEISGATLIEYEGIDHFTYAGDMDSVVDDLERWVTGSVAPRPLPRPAGMPTIATLGRFAVEIDGSEVTTAEWGSRLPRQILKRLVTTQGWPVTREQLIDQLWPDETDLRKAGARLSVHLSAVRRVLGGGIVADRETVRLDLDAVSIDIRDFLALTDEVAIVAAYAGEYLPEDIDEAWLNATRDQARKHFVDAARTLMARDLESGDADAVHKLTSRLIEVDPYDEVAHRTLVVALLHTGDLGNARAAHLRWQSAMEELGISVEPLEELVASEAP